MRKDEDIMAEENIKSLAEAYEKSKKEFAETHKPAVCKNPNCQREIQPGATINVVPSFRDEIFCSAECLAEYYGGYELEFNADDEEYASWFEKKEDKPDN